MTSSNAAARTTMAPTARGTGWPGSDNLPALRPGDAVHLVGIGGAGMSGLALVLSARGLRVSGSDRSPSFALERLGAAGIVVHDTHHADHVPATTKMLIPSPAIPPENVELRCAVERGIPVHKRAELLGALMDNGTGVAIAGTHGKTTTTGWLATVLLAAGLDPTVFVGGAVDAMGSNARAGAAGTRSEAPDEPQAEGLVLVEADEYDQSFHHGHPFVAVITNVEHDHPDIYTAAGVEQAFLEFAGLVRSAGRLILWGGTPNASALAAASKATTEVYAVEGDAIADDLRPRWFAHGIVTEATRTVFDVSRDGTCLGTFVIHLHGRHNVANALAVVAVCAALGLEPVDQRQGLAAYRGAERRMDVLGRIGGVRVVDDYAHHPTEIRATIDAARARWPQDTLWSVVQPHTFSRVAVMEQGFADAAGRADHVVWTPIFGARERAADFPGVRSEALAARLEGSRLVPDIDASAALIAAEATGPATALFLGAGDIPRASRAALRALGARAVARVALTADAEALPGRRMGAMDLSAFTSLRVGGPADLVVVVEDPDALAGWARLAHEHGAPCHVIGRGSNILIDDDGLPGIVLVNRCEAWTVREHSAAAGDSAVLHTEGGVTLAALAHSLARQGWAGLEAGVGIPGSVAGAIVNNAGAHGWQMEDSILRVEVSDATGERSWWPVDALALRYRDSAIKGRHDLVILRAELRLHADDPDAIRARIATFTAHRRATQPSSPSVGSMFRNPEGDYAGRLIEAAGLKGQRLGAAEVSTKHANFFINRGGARAADVQGLIKEAHGRVRSRFGVDLHLEIETLGGRSHDV